jgi:hypothetical protein
LRRTVDELIDTLYRLTDRQRVDFARWVDAVSMLRDAPLEHTFVIGKELKACRVFDRVGDGSLSLAEAAALRDDAAMEAIWYEAGLVIGAMVRSLEDANQRSLTTLTPAFQWLEDAASGMPAQGPSCQPAP